MDGRTIGGRISQSGGGVARNVADALGKLQVKPLLVSAVGEEQFGNFLLKKTIPHLPTRGVIRREDTNTGTCMVLCDDKGECLVVVGDMDIHEKITRDHVRAHEEAIAACFLLVLDGNLSQETTEFVLWLCHKNSVPVWFEPTDVSLASKPFFNKEIPPPTFISPNLQEFRKIFETVFPDENLQEGADVFEECRIKGYLLGRTIDNIIITLGKKGVMVFRKGEASNPFYTTGKHRKCLKMNGPISHRLYTCTLIGEEEIVNVSGAGDCFASGFIAAMLQGENEKSCIEFGFKCSEASLKCSDTVPKKF